MTIQGKVSLFWMTNVNDTEDSIINKIEFEGDAKTPDANSKLISFKPTLSKTETVNPAPFQNVSRKPDAGFAGARYTLNIFFDESITTAKAIAKLRDWLREENYVAGKFKEGRIGLRNNYRPEFNLTPDNTAGYKIIHFELDQNLTINSIIPATITLEFSGDPARLGV